MAGERPRFLIKILEAMDKHEAKIFELSVIPLLHKVGVETITSPRELQMKMVELIRNAVDIKMAVCDEWLYLMCLPREVTPNSWEEITEMMEVFSNRSNSGIRITNAPMGSPPEIAQGWIGTTIPFSTDMEYPINYPLVFITPELEEKDFVSKDGKCYVVKSKTAVEALAQVNPSAAEAFKNYMPKWEDENRTLIFDDGSCEIVSSIS